MDVWEELERLKSGEGITLIVYILGVHSMVTVELAVLFIVLLTLTSLGGLPAGQQNTSTVLAMTLLIEKSQFHFNSYFYKHNYC